MATHKDCLYKELCESHKDICVTEKLQNVDKECPHFKDKADVVEVVRCKDCRHGEKTTQFRTDCTTKCGLHNKTMFDNDFCSYGERRDT